MRPIHLAFLPFVVLLAAVAPLPLLARACAQEPTGERADLDEAHQPSPAIEVDVEARRVSFEGVLVQNGGLLEAYVCGPAGRTHETLFVSTVKPEDFLAAAARIGIRAATEWARNERELFAIQGDKVVLRIEFADGRTVVAEDLVTNDYERRPMRRRGWTLHAKRFDAGLPDEIEFSLTFKGLRGTALSMLDSPYAYRPFANVPLTGRTEALPDLEAEGKELHHRVRLVLEPATEVAIARLALEQPGAPPAAAAEPFLEAAARIDALKAAYAKDVLPLLAAPEGEAEDDRARRVARIDAAALEIEVAYYDLDLLHERRELAALQASEEPDARVLDYKKWVVGILETYRQSALEELEAARAAQKALELARAGAPEKEVRRAELTRDLHRARVRALNKKPHLEEAREQLRIAATDWARGHFTRLVEVLAAEVGIAEGEAKKAGLERDLLEAEGERKAELEAILVGLEREIEASRRIVAIYRLEEERGKLRRDLRFYQAEGIADEAKAAEVQARLAEVEAELERFNGEGR